MSRTGSRRVGRIAATQRAAAGCGGGDEVAAGVSWEIRHGDAARCLRDLPSGVVDAVVTDPPYGLEFMGRDWDAPWESDPHVGRRWNTGIGKIAMADGAERLDRPSYEKRSNVRCRRCGKWKLSSNPCSCAGPDFPDPRLSNMRAFQEWCEGWAREVLRVLKPGGHLVAFGGTRTYHRLTAGIEDAGFEIRDCVTWLYGSGFPKSLDVSKAIDKRKDRRALALLEGKVKAAREALGISQSEAARRCGLIGPDERSGGGGFMWFETGMSIPTREQYPRLKEALGLDDECDRAFEEAEREITGTVEEWTDRSNYALTSRDGFRRDIPATPDAERWQGWGTGLKPGHEPIVVARKPLVGNVAQNVLQHGTGALNVDACRLDGAKPGGGGAPPFRFGGQNPRAFHEGAQSRGTDFDPTLGRWPANVVLDERGAELLDAQTGTLVSGRESEGGHRRNSDKFRTTYGDFAGTEREPGVLYGDSGGASRFFYCAKASRPERNAGLEGFETKMLRWSSGDQSPGTFQSAGTDKSTRNHHPTVKPIELMRWLIRLVTPPGGLVLDPFAGSGTTGCAALLEGFGFIGIERDHDYAEIAKARIAWWLKHRGQGPTDAILAAGDARDQREAHGQLSLLE